MSGLKAGTRPEDGACTPRGRDFRRFLEQEFVVTLGYQATYNLSHRFGLGRLKPRPQHPEADEASLRARLTD